MSKFYDFIHTVYVNRFNVEGYTEDVKALNIPGPGDQWSVPMRDVERVAAKYGFGPNTIITDNHRLNHRYGY